MKKPQRENTVMPEPRELAEEARSDLASSAPTASVGHVTRLPFRKRENVGSDPLEYFAVLEKDGMGRGMLLDFEAEEVRGIATDMLVGAIRLLAANTVSEVYAALHLAFIGSAPGTPEATS